MTIRIESLHFTADQKLDEFIHRKVGKLAQYFDRIMDAHVVLKLESAKQIKDKVVEVQLRVPGDMIIGSETDKTFEAAVDKVVDVLKRQLIKHKERVRSH